MQFSTYNGWENKFTWLVHLHLSNEFALANEIAELVAQEPNNAPAGHLVEMWVKVAVENWITSFSGRNSDMMSLSVYSFGTCFGHPWLMLIGMRSLDC